MKGDPNDCWAVERPDSFGVGDASLGNIWRRASIIVKEDGSSEPGPCDLDHEHLSRKDALRVLHALRRRTLRYLKGRVREAKEKVRSWVAACEDEEMQELR